MFSRPTLHSTLTAERFESHRHLSFTAKNSRRDLGRHRRKLPYVELAFLQQAFFSILLKRRLRSRVGCFAMFACVQEGGSNCVSCVAHALSCTVQCWRIWMLIGARVKRSCRGRLTCTGSDCAFANWNANARYKRNLLVWSVSSVLRHSFSIMAACPLLASSTNLGSSP